MAVCNFVENKYPFLEQTWLQVALKGIGEILCGRQPGAFFNPTPRISEPWCCSAPQGLCKTKAKVSSWNFNFCLHWQFEMTLLVVACFIRPCTMFSTCQLARDERWTVRVTHGKWLVRSTPEVTSRKKHFPLPGRCEIRDIWPVSRKTSQNKSTVTLKLEVWETH